MDYTELEVEKILWHSLREILGTPLYGGPPHPLASAPPRPQLACSIRPPRSSPSPFGRTSRRRRLLTPAHGAVRFLPPARRPAAAAHACTRRYDLALAPCRLYRGGY